MGKASHVETYRDRDHLVDAGGRVGVGPANEASVSIGYAANDGIASEPRFLLGQTYDTAGIDDGTS